MFIYLFAVSGVMITLHYCGPNVESWKVYAKSDGCEEGECGDESEQNDGCCKDEVIAAKISNDQHTVSEFKLKLSPDVWIAPAIPNHFEIQGTYAVAVKATAHQPNAPPGRWQDIPLYKLHSGFIYYG
jgi:hypothetical protein